MKNGNGSTQVRPSICSFYIDQQLPMNSTILRTLFLANHRVATIQILLTSSSIFIELMILIGRKNTPGTSCLSMGVFTHASTIVQTFFQWCGSGWSVPGWLTDGSRLRLRIPYASRVGSQLSMIISYSSNHRVILITRFHLSTSDRFQPLH